jgi:hypothetical protein
LPSEQTGIKYKKENRTSSISPNKKKTRVEFLMNISLDKCCIPFEYKVGDQVLSETPGFLWKLSTPCTGPYPVMNVYKNGTIRIQK